MLRKMGMHGQNHVMGINASTLLIGLSAIISHPTNIAPHINFLCTHATNVNSNIECKSTLISFSISIVYFVAASSMLPNVLER